MRFIFLFYTLLLFILNVGFSGTEETNSTTDYIAVPGKPGRLDIQNITDTSVHVIWTAPASKVNITQYVLEAKIIHTFSSEMLYNTQTRTFSNNIFRSEIDNLHPGTKYNISIRALSKNGLGIPNFAIFETQIAEPDQTPEDIKIIGRNGPKMVVKISPVDNNNGPVSFYRLVVMNLNQMQIFEPELLRPYDRAVADGLSYYIAADIKAEDIEREFVIGDRRTYNGFYNAPLERDSKYYAFVGVVSNFNGLTKVRYPDISSQHSSLANEPRTENSGLVMGLAVAVGFASVLLIVGIIILVLVRRRFHQNRRQRLSDNQELCVQGPMIQVANNGYIPDDDFERVNHYDSLKKTVWSIPRDNLQVDATADGESFLGFGSFGHVVRGTVQKLNERNPTVCACYVVTDGDLTQQRKRAMLRQLDVLIKTGDHENIAGLIGTNETPENVYIVLEHTSLNLKEILVDDRRANRSNGKFTTINENDMINILIGISNGMLHLSQKNLTHERLCARNIFMFNGHTPKITGHGLSHYNRSNAALDLSRWTAQEVLSGKQFSVKSDVWSFGVLLWECCCIGGTPYNRLDKKMFTHQVCRGVRLPKFPWISEELYQVMIGCWQTDPGERPSFHEIIEQLNYFKETLTMYHHLNFDLTPDFVFEVYDPSMELAGEDICQRSIIQS